MDEYGCGPDAIGPVLVNMFKVSVKRDFGNLMEEDESFRDDEIRRFKREANYDIEKGVYTFTQDFMDTFILQSVNNAIEHAMNTLVELGLAELYWSDTNGGEPAYRVMTLDEMNQERNDDE